MSKKIVFVNEINSKLDLNKEDILEQWNNPKDTVTKHFVIDNLLTEEHCSSIYYAFPNDFKKFNQRKTLHEKKKTSANINDYPEIISDIIHAIQDETVISKIETILKIKGLEKDPTLYAGGLSSMSKGDFLDPHIDNSHDRNREKYRRLNLLYYVSPHWNIENGANFELWNKDVSIPKTIVSKFNRLIVMETNKNSWHSVSKCLVEKPRVCVSIYLFSQNSPTGKDYFHVTSFKGRPDQKIKNAYSLIDNKIRNVFSKITKFGRGKKL